MQLFLVVILAMAVNAAWQFGTDGQFIYNQDWPGVPDLQHPTECTWKLREKFAATTRIANISLPGTNSASWRAGQEKRTKVALLAASLLIASSNEIRLNFCQCLSVCLLNNGRTQRTECWSTVVRKFSLTASREQSVPILKVNWHFWIQLELHFDVCWISWFEICEVNKRRNDMKMNCLWFFVFFDNEFQLM